MTIEKLQRQNEVVTRIRLLKSGYVRSDNTIDSVESELDGQQIEADKNDWVYW